MYSTSISDISKVQRKLSSYFKRKTYPIVYHHFTSLYAKRRLRIVIHRRGIIHVTFNHSSNIDQ